MLIGGFENYLLNKKRFMKKQNEQLKQTLIEQYSKLCHTSESIMIDRLNNIDWWNKEQYRLKIQRNVFLIGSWIIFFCFCIVVIITFVKGSNNLGLLSVPLISFAGLIFALLIGQRVLSQTEEKIRLYELLQLIFDKNKNGA